MELERVQKQAIIPEETGILRQRGYGFHMAVPFAQEHLFYVFWENEYECDTSYRVDRNFLEAYQLMFLKKGTMELRYSGKEYRITEGQTVFLDMRVPHYYAALSEITLQQYLMNGNASKAYFELLYNQGGPCFSASDSLSLLFQALSDEFMETIPNDHRISALIHNILSSLEIQSADQFSGKLSEPVRKAQEFIAKHYNEPVSVEQIAAESGLSKYYFIRLFRKDTGFTPWEYLISIRMRQAMYLLTATSKTIEEIGAECGFASTSHFIRTFKKQAHLTPSRFRHSFTGVPFA